MSCKKLCNTGGDILTCCESFFFHSRPRLPVIIEQQWLMQNRLTIMAQMRGARNFATEASLVGRRKEAKFRATKPAGFEKQMGH
jgi:hypothetical protein